MNVQHKVVRKKSVNLSIDAELLADSKDAGVNLSRVLEEALRELRIATWRREASEAIKQENASTEKNGVWNAGHRPW